MKDFIKYLKKKYNAPISDLSKTQFKNKLISSNFELINFEEMSNDVPKLDNKFKGNNFTTADALFISNKCELILHFIEFKNLDFEDEKDYKLSKYWLKDCITKMKNCEHDCFINDKKDKITKSQFHKYLTDKAIANMKLKPIDSLSILFHHFNFFNLNDEEFCKNKIFNTKKFFIIVSKTKILENYPFNKNISNKQMSSIFDPYKTYLRLEPFYYSKFIAINHEVFEEYISNFIN